MSGPAAVRFSSVPGGFGNLRGNWLAAGPSQLASRGCVVVGGGSECKSVRRSTSGGRSNFCGRISSWGDAAARESPIGVELGPAAISHASVETRD